MKIIGKSMISVHTSEYDNWNSTVELFATNSSWSGKLKFFIGSEFYKKFLENLIKFEGDQNSKVELEFGDIENKKCAYYFKFLAEPRDLLRHIKISIHMIDRMNRYNGSESRFEIWCTYPELQGLGKLMQKSMLERSTEFWEINNVDNS